MLTSGTKPLNGWMLINLMPTVSLLVKSLQAKSRLFMILELIGITHTLGMTSHQPTPAGITPRRHEPCQ